MAHAERAPLLGVRARRARDDDDDRPSASHRAESPERGDSGAIGVDDDRRRSRRGTKTRKYRLALTLIAMSVMLSAMMMSAAVTFVRKAASMATTTVRTRRVGVAPRAREVLSDEALRAFPWLVEETTATIWGGGVDVDDVGALGRRAHARARVELEDPLEAELERNAHALDRARTVEDFVAMSVQVDDAHAVGRKPLREWAHRPGWYEDLQARGSAMGTNLEFGDEAFTVCLYNLHRWSRPIGTSTWAEDLSAVLDAKRGVRAAARENLKGRCVKEVLHTNSRSEERCMEADVVIFRGDTMLKPSSSLGVKRRLAKSSARSAGSSDKADGNATASARSLLRERLRKAPEAARRASNGAVASTHAHAKLGNPGEDIFVTHLPQKSRRDQVYMYVSTAAPAAEQTGQDLRDQMLLSQVDYLATSNSALESVWRSPLPTAKFMISSFDAFLRPFRMRVPLIGFGDSAAACKHGRSVGAHILRRISQKYPVESFGTCMKNYDASWFVPNLGVSASSAETIRTQLQLSKYLFYYVAEEVDCPGHVTEKLWLPLLRGSIPVYFGTKTVDDYLPCPKKDCVLRVKDFDSVDALVRRMREIADDQKLYESLTAWRHEVPSNWPERFRTGVARASLDIQAVVCDVMRDGDDARRRGSQSNFAAAAPQSAPWLIQSYPNKHMDMDAVIELEKSGARDDSYCVRQERVSALGEVFADRVVVERPVSNVTVDALVAANASTNASTNAAEVEDEDEDELRLADPSRLYTKVCDYEAAACGRLLPDPTIS